MVNRIATVALAVAAGAALALAPADASAGETVALTLQGWGGVSRYDVGGLEHGLDDAGWGRDLLQDRVGVYGASLLLRLGTLDVGALYEGKLIRRRTDAAVITPLVGWAIELGTAVRLDLLGELGGHRISNVRFDATADVTQAESVWLPYVGARPTLTLRFPLGPAKAVVSVAPFARWDLLRKQVTLRAGDTTAATRSYEVGGATFGLVAGAGIEL